MPDTQTLVDAMPEDWSRGRAEKAVHEAARSGAVEYVDHTRLGKVDATAKRGSTGFVWACLIGVPAVAALVNWWLP